MNTLTAVDTLSRENAGDAAHARLRGARLILPVARPKPAPRRWLDPEVDVTIRRATLADVPDLDQLAVLASADRLAGEVLVAEVEGELWAACSVTDGRIISDPFRPTRVARSLLDLRRKLLVAAREGRPYGEPARFSLLRRRRTRQSLTAVRIVAHGADVMGDEQGSCSDRTW